MWGMALAVPIAFLLFIQAVWYLMFGTITPYTECFSAISNIISEVFLHILGRQYLLWSWV